MSKVNIRIVFSKGEGLSVHDTFHRVVAMILEADTIKGYDPLMLIFSTGKILYFDKETFFQFNQGEMSHAELIRQTECQGLFRNKTFIKSGKYEIEPESLWLLRGKELVLIDSDEHITMGAAVADKLFYEIK